MTKLSICIPTYNFGKFIGETLDSILLQITSGVEVVVLDGGSTDNTKEIIEAYQKKHPELKYHYQSFRGGIDRDIETVVSLGKGKYCWGFSADDIMQPGAIQTVLKAIESDYDIYLAEHVLCSLDMTPLQDHPPFINLKQPKLFDLSDPIQKEDYFRSARTSEAFFSFLAGPIFKKEVWDSVAIPESFRSTYWIVAGHLLSTFTKGPTIYYLHKQLLHKRGDNDSFAVNGILKRYQIAIENFQYVAHIVFRKDSKEAFHIRRVLKLDVSLYELLALKLHTWKIFTPQERELFSRLVKIHYSDPIFSNWVKRIICAWGSPSLFHFLYRGRVRTLARSFRNYLRRKKPLASS